MPATLTSQERESLLDRFDAVARNGPLNVLTRKRFLDLAALQSPGWVLSVYVDLSPQNRHGDAWAIGLKSATRDALAVLEDRRAQEAARAELVQVERWLRDKVSGLGRGVALFRCPDQEVSWELSLPISLPTRVRLGKRPYLRPLARVRDEHARAAAVVLDQQRARLFLVQLGFLEEVADIIEDVPGHHKQGGRSQMRFQRHHDAHVVWHAGAVAHATQLLLERVEARHLFVSGSSQVLAEYREHLPAAAAKLWSGEFSVPIEASATEVTAALAPPLAQAEAREECAAIGRINDAVSADRAVWGLRSVLRAANERRLRVLVVHDRYRAPGAECPRCGGLYPQRDTACPVDQTALLPVEDVVDALLEAAAVQEAELELVRSDSGRTLLPQAEPVGALLRF